MAQATMAPADEMTSAEAQRLLDDAVHARAEVIEEHITGGDRTSAERLIGLDAAVQLAELDVERARHREQSEQDADRQVVVDAGQERRRARAAEDHERKIEDWRRAIRRGLSPEQVEALRMRPDTFDPEFLAVWRERQM